MLQQTFLHIPGISKEVESHIWKNDILNWHEFHQQGHSLDLPTSKIFKIKEHVEKSIHALQHKNHQFFNLPSKEEWRLYQDFKEHCCFLDIETTGLSKHYNYITTIGLYDGESSRVFVKDQDLHEFAQEIAKYKVIVTFNGKCFDLPFLRSSFPDIDFHHIHLDLRYLMKDLGYSGGLKRIEKEVGINRDDELAEVDGFEAVRLWRRYKKGDLQSLELLKKYNEADVVNLKTLMEFTYGKLKEKTLFN
ncbi:ribonuclease H-like domain-containing protein [Candidatus Woesearchaeota archaeon]|jgi:hypothetical protein|nr:ribonuclease H-like domain-containing protein [Candidatus Woesearchaeota archaeon]MBT4151056.1 ribonuclease H-like domain-containing protein [Candidatus Woesearchaeota archaeon]MBT4433846.1 ribonuclease H-like domain-containing protein [Candidatus Woesearchaeota archaeon]MBT7332155.1 ribonuclease H-like domain-containing protein [Candidatus Woesearchaeota archaeon]